MEEWQLDFEWLRVKHLVKDLLKRDELPNMNAILFLIGIQELGRPQTTFTKEEKQDLMHIAICRLLSYDGYYKFLGRDEDGWPHFEQLKAHESRGVENQEQVLKAKVIQYFNEWEAEGK